MGRPKGSKNILLRLNTIREINNTIEIIIESPKYGILICVIDPEDYPKVCHTRWQAIKRRNVFHAQSCSNHSEYMHRLILTDTNLIDHKDGDGLNNRKSNLRKATKSQNAMNSFRNKKYKGVVKLKNGRFLSRIVLDQKQIYLGTYTSEIEAAIKYNEAALTYFKEFAKLNLIPDMELL